MTGSYRTLLATLAAAMAALQAGIAGAATPPPERFEIGVNMGGESCSVTRQWTGAGGDVRLAKDQPYGITCRGISAAEPQGYVSAPGSPPDTKQCGDPATATLRGIGPVEVRRCIDARLNRTVIDLRFERKGVVYQGAALEPTLGPLEAALRVIVAGEPAPASNLMIRASISTAAVPAGPIASTAARNTLLTAESALTDGVAALQAGRMLDASRILNDALRAFADADASRKIDLRLAAGLADSNLSQFTAADQHFAAADQLMQANPELRDSARQEQLTVYRGLHLINQHDWKGAIAALERGDGSRPDLSNRVTVARLNSQGPVSGDSLQSALADADSLATSLLAAQRFWALSVAYLGLGDIDAANRALERATAVSRDPVSKILPDRIVWLRAAIERQKGRIEARRGNIPAALASFDCAITALQGTTSRSPQSCMLVPGAALPDTAVNAPLLVETQLEQASAASRDPKADRSEVLKTYNNAVQSLSNLSGTGYVSLAALERYFALLTQSPADATRDEEYFRAMQMIGEPAIAREYLSLQRVLSSNPQVADLLRQRTDLERQLIRLRYEIAASSGAAEVDLGRLEQERARIEAERDDVNNRLLYTPAAKLEDQPATIASVREQLAPGEVFFKLVALNSTMFGIVIGRDETQIYQLGGSLADIETMANAILATTRLDSEGYTKLYEVATAQKLFATIAGPAAPMLSKAGRIIYNPAGILRQLPISILVTDPGSVAAYQKQQAKGDYSKVAFLGRTAEASTALSPRAFLIGRTNPTLSQAPNPFLGLGENAAPQLIEGAVGDQPMPFDCSVSYDQWAVTLSGREPVKADEIGVAARALGLSDVPEIVRGDFTDANLLSGPDSGRLSQYQILHFATHGIPETPVMVDRCSMRLPPALITTLAPPTANGTIVSDGMLSFDEVARLRLNANLVVLSACETFAGASTEVARLGGLEESTPALDGLVRSFIVANARSVMATFWRVPAIKQSDDLMGAFYGAGRTQTIAASLKVAQLLLMDQPRYSHPYFWGAYFLVGDGSKPMLTPATQTASR